MFTGNSLSEKKLYFLYNADTRHYNATTNIKAAMVERYMFNACDTLYDNTHKCEKACCMLQLDHPVLKIRPVLYTCNRWFLSEKC